MNQRTLWQIERPRTWAEARLNSIVPLENNRAATVDERIAYARDTSWLTPGQKEELELLQKARRNPMREYAKWFEKLLKKDQEKGEQWREFFPLSEYIAAEREYRKQAGKSYGVQFRGPPGTGKSLAAQTAEQQQDLDFIPREQTFFLYEDCQAQLQRNWPSGKAFVMDEEPKRFGCLTPETELLVPTGNETVPISLNALAATNLLMRNQLAFPVLSVNAKQKIEVDEARIVESGIKEVFRITLDDGSTINASAEQPFFVFDSVGTLKVKRLDELKKGDEIVAIGS